MAFENLLAASTQWISAAQERKRREQEKEQFEKQYKLASEQWEYEKPLKQKEAEKMDIENKLYQLKYDEEAKMSNFIDFGGLYVPAYKKSDGSLDIDKIKQEYYDLIKKKNSFYNYYFSTKESGGSKQNEELTGNASGIYNWYVDQLKNFIANNNEIKNKDELLALIDQGRIKEAISKSNQKAIVEFLTYTAYATILPSLNQGMIKQEHYKQFADMVKASFGFDLTDTLNQYANGNPVYSNWMYATQQDINNLAKKTTTPQIQPLPNTPPKHNTPNSSQNSPIYQLYSYPTTYLEKTKNMFTMVFAPKKYSPNGLPSFEEIVNVLNTGLFTKGYIDNILKNISLYPPSIQKELLDLLKKYKK